jgi:hypothetical protein
MRTWTAVKWQVVNLLALATLSVAHGSHAAAPAGLSGTDVPQAAESASVDDFAVTVIEPKGARGCEITVRDGPGMTIFQDRSGRAFTMYHTADGRITGLNLDGFYVTLKYGADSRGLPAGYVTRDGAEHKIDTSDEARERARLHLSQGRFAIGGRLATILCTSGQTKMLPGPDVLDLSVMTDPGYWDEVFFTDQMDGLNELWWQQAAAQSMCQQQLQECLDSCEIRAWLETGLCIGAGAAGAVVGGPVGAAAVGIACWAGIGTARFSCVDACRRYYRC